jgi:DNA primase
MRTSVWVYESYPFLYQEMKAIEEAIKRVYGVQAIYCREWVNGHQVDEIILSNGAKAVHQAIANSIKVMHVQQAVLTSRYDSQVQTLENIQIIIGERPNWAQL